MGIMKRLNVKRMLKEAKHEEPRPAFMHRSYRAKTKSQGSQKQLFQEQNDGQTRQNRTSD